MEKVVFKVMNNIQPVQQAVGQPKNQQQERDFQLSHFWVFYFHVRFVTSNKDTM